ncbi:hypothetical protein DV515_00018289, partial [Chloebia gouldiae]
ENEKWDEIPYLDLFYYLGQKTEWQKECGIMALKVEDSQYECSGCKTREVCMKCAAKSSRREEDLSLAIAPSAPPLSRERLGQEREEVESDTDEEEDEREVTDFNDSPGSQGNIQTPAASNSQAHSPNKQRTPIAARTRHGRRNNEGPHMIAPLREAMGPQGGRVLIKVPFSPGDLVIWKQSAGSYREDPERVARVVKMVIKTQNPDWNDLQVLLDTIMDSTEKEMVLRATKERAREEIKLRRNREQGYEGTVDELVPSDDPEWNPNSADGYRAIRKYQELLVEGVWTGMPKTLNWSKLYSVRQEKNESPSAFLERLKETARRYTNLEIDEEPGGRVKLEIPDEEIGKIFVIQEVDPTPIPDEISNAVVPWTPLQEERSNSPGLGYPKVLKTALLYSAINWRESWRNGRQLSRQDLKDEPLDTADWELFTDGSSFVENGTRYARYSVVTVFQVIEARALTPGTSAQKAEIIGLTRALILSTGRKVNIWTDSKYAFGVVHIHGALWRERGLLSSQGTAIKHQEEVVALLDAVHKPEQVAVMHVRRHQKEDGKIFRGNRLADAAAREAARQVWTQMALIPTRTNPANPYLQQPPRYSREDEKLAALLKANKNATGWYVTNTGQVVVPSWIMKAILVAEHNKSHWSAEALVKFLKSEIVSNRMLSLAKRVNAIILNALRGALQWNRPLSLENPVHDVQPGDQVYVKNWSTDPLRKSWSGPHQVILTTYTAVKVAGMDSWIHYTRIKKAPTQWVSQAVTPTRLILRAN